MKKLLAIVLDPLSYFVLKKRQERLVLLAVACLACNVEEPSVWDVDKLHKSINHYLEAIHNDPAMLDGMGHMKKSLFWHRLVSRLKKVELEREDVKATVDDYAFVRGLIDGKSGSACPAAVAAWFNAAVKMFGTY